MIRASFRDLVPETTISGFRGFRSQPAGQNVPRLQKILRLAWSPRTFGLRLAEFVLFRLFLIKNIVASFWLKNGNF
jgi:hypothetical protein